MAKSFAAAIDRLSLPYFLSQDHTSSPTSNYWALRRGFTFLSFLAPLLTHLCVQSFHLPSKVIDIQAVFLLSYSGRSQLFHSSGIVFITPDNARIPHSLALTKGCSNNETEYEALIAFNCLAFFSPSICNSLALEASITRLQVFGDLELVIKQAHGTYIVKRRTFVPYYERAKHLIIIRQFQEIKPSDGG